MHAHDEAHAKFEHKNTLKLHTQTNTFILNQQNFYLYSFKINAMEELTRLRHELHRNPELSGQERGTAKRLRFFLSRYKPNSSIPNVAGNGMIVIYNGIEDGPTLLFRCDMDAIPVKEDQSNQYKSLIPDISHGCGHDGHMAIVSGLAIRLHQQPPQKGRVALLYQPSEENGQGAEKVVDYIKSHPEITPDYTFGLHNMPKYPKGEILIAKHIFSAASKGLIINLTGRNSHAAYPERGLNPAAATAEIIQSLLNLKDSHRFKSFVLVTIVHVKIGEVAFGTSAGSAVIMATLRAFSNDDMAILSKNAVDSATQIAQRYGLGFENSFTDTFPATNCDPELTQLVDGICSEKHFAHAYLEEPNRWSEDFAHYAALGKSLIFGLGAGENQPEIHSPGFNFPDDIIDNGVDMMEAIVRKILG